MINFSPLIPEEEKLKICKMLDDRDKELTSAYHEIVMLENKLERFNGALNYSESEALKTAMAINNGILEQVRAGLKNYNLRYVECPDAKSPHAFPIRIEKIGILERITTFLKSLIKFTIVRKV